MQKKVIMKQTLIFVILVIMICCNNGHNVKTSTNTLRTIEDTLMQFQINGEKKEYRVRKNIVIDLVDFKRVMEKYSSNLMYKSQSSLEITGEGYNNYYSTLIQKFNDGFLVSNTIKQNDSIIWMDTLSINDRVWYYWDDSVFFKLKPYSQFFIAYKYFSEFVGENFDTTSNFYHNGKYVIHALIKYDTDSAYWNNYLGNFKGRLIYKMSIEDPGTYIWDKRLHKFIDFYEP
jgi:hypothetical protein